MLFSSDLVFTLRDMLEFCAFAFATGVLSATVRSNSRTIKGNRQEYLHLIEKLRKDHAKDVEWLEERHLTLERRFLKAIEDLGQNISSLTTELKTALAVTDQRLGHLEREKE